MAAGPVPLLSAVSGRHSRAEPLEDARLMGTGFPVFRQGEDNSLWVPGVRYTDSASDPETRISATLALELLWLSVVSQYG
jgi:hypothetical protein